MTENTDPIGSLRVADSATGQFAEGGLLATATLVPFIPEATATTTPTATPLPPIVLPEAPVPADGQSFLFMPTAPEVVGWAKANDEVSNHFGDYSLFAGIFDGAPHIGAMQFDLSQIPPGSPILYADLTLTGLSNEWLIATGTWRIQMLTEWMDTDWSKRDYHWLSRADSGTLWLDGEAISSALAEWQNNTFYFSPDALAMLEARLFRGKVSFRVVGPIEGENNLFAWDSGFGARSHGRAPILRIVTGGPAPATPPPSPTPNYVIITLTPDDANALVALAAERLTATAQATPDPNGATPAPTATPTPFPPNWVTPVIVINTPVPENNATAVWQAEVATAQAIVRGTATATPPNVWTATATPLPPPPTPTPLVVAYDLLTPTATPSATPDALPALLRGKIIFYSDRTGSATLMVMEPDGSNVALWTGGDPEWIYAQAKAFEDYSPDRRFRIIVSSEQINNLQLWSLDLQTKSKQQLTHLADVAYDPVWSPTSDVIAFVSPAPGNDELYLINADGSGLTQLSFNQWEWDKHPSWSPDGRQLVFWSNRETQRKQIWIMQADGSNVRNLSNNQFNDWDPIWVK